MTETLVLRDDVPVARCVVRKCHNDAVEVVGTLSLCLEHSELVPMEASPTMLDVLITLMMSDSVDDLQAAIDMLVEIIGLVPLEGSYAGGWTERDLFRFGLEESSDAQDL